MQKRIAAEWEPALGVMITWPLHVPKALVRAYSEDGKLFVIAGDEEEEKGAEETFKRWGVNMDNVRFVLIPRGIDASWPRDWGPHPIFTEDKKFVIGCPTYRFSTPNVRLDNFGKMYNPYEIFDDGTVDENLKDEDIAQFELKEGEYLSPLEDAAASCFADLMGYDKVKLPTLTGGNMFSDGHGNMISNYAILNESRYNGVGKEEFLAEVGKKCGMRTYSWISNYEDFGIQHVDCLFKLCDDETILMTRLPKDHPHHQLYEDILHNEIEKLRTYRGTPFKIFRLDAGIYKDAYGGDATTAYANSIIVNKNVYVPMYDIEQDQIALEQWQEAMPGYHIKGFSYRLSECEPCENQEMYGEQETLWASYDVIHCRTRAVWDPEMLYVSVWQKDAQEYDENGYPVDVTIVDYSNAGLVREKTALYWRVKGESEWNREVLEESPAVDRYIGVIPANKKGVTIEYYAQAADNSGREETMPRVAPEGVYEFDIK